MKLELKPFDQAAFDAAYKVFHSTAPAPIVQIGTLEYVAAALATMREGDAAHNISLTALDHMTPAAAQYVDAYFGTPAFQEEVNATVIELIGMTHWFDAP